MDARRDNIASSQRAQIAVDVLSSQRRWSTVTRLAEAYEISRQTVYNIVAAGEQVLTIGLEPGSHGWAKNTNKLARPYKCPVVKRQGEG